MTWRVPYRIETERLVLRVYEVDDAEPLADAVNESRAHLSRYLPWARGPEDLASARRAWIQSTRNEFDTGHDYTMGIFARNDGRLLGGTGFHPRTEPTRLDIGYWIAADAQGKGYVTEAAAALTRVAFGLANARIVSIAHAPTNSASAAVPQRLGFVRQDEPIGPCTDGADSVEAVVWFAGPEVLAREPLASFPRPLAFDAVGRELEWPA